MATIRQRKTGNWEVIIRRNILPRKSHSATFKTEAEARDYSFQLERLLDQGIVPAELQAIDPASDNFFISDWARKYLAEVAMTDSDRKIVNALFIKMDNWPVSFINIDWALQWISEMKRVDRLSPTTIKHKVGAVARLLDWCLIKKWIELNPLRMLPTAYSGST